MTFSRCHRRACGACGAPGPRGPSPVRLLLVVLLLVAARPDPGLGGQWRTAGRVAWNRGTGEGMEVSPAGRLRLVSFAGTNVARGMRATADGRNISTRLTDGKASTGWSFLDDPEVLGRAVAVDLRGNRLIDRVRVLAGDTDDPESFVKGYRIEAAPAETPDAWQVVARRRVNRRRTVDTTADSTWTRFEGGDPVPITARFVRLVITRQDLPNRVHISEFEILGAGFQTSGEYVSTVRDFRRLVNVGPASWQVEAPRGTALRLQVRTSTDNVDWPAWETVPEQAVGAPVAVASLPPKRYAQWRILADTRDPVTSPEVTSVSLAFEPRLIAASARGRVRPRQAVLGVPVRLTYVADLRIGDDDRGVDVIAFDRPGQVEEVRVDGVPMAPSQYRSVALDSVGAQVPPLALRLQPGSRLDGPVRVEVDFTTAFFAETSTVDMFLGSAVGDSTILQRVTPVRLDSLRVVVSGVLEMLVDPASARMEPPVVRPAGPRSAWLRFDLGRVQVPVPVSVTIFDLTGRPVRRLLRGESLRAGPVAIPWDGRNDHGRALVPGIYLVKIQVQADRPQTLVRTVGVGY